MTALTGLWERRGGKQKIKKRECRQPGSNQRPSDLQSDALPTELYRRVLGHGEAGTGRWDTVVVKRGHEGIEPSTSPTLKENHTTRPMARAGGGLQRAREAGRGEGAKQKKRGLLGVGFEPTPPERLELESSALDRSAIQACCLISSALTMTNADVYKTKQKMEHRGFDPRTSCLQSTHSSD